jgi:hypothetical protein
MARPTILSEDLLEIYLNDHLGGAVAGRALARRAAGANRGTEFGPPLDVIAAEIAEDLDALRGTIERLGRRRDRLKVAAGWTAERAGRLKLNGRLRGYSPLSRLVEIEGLAVGVRAKGAPQRALRTVADRHPGLDAAGLDRLIARADDQHTRLVELHRRAAAIALAP